MFVTKKFLEQRLDFHKILADREVREVREYLGDEISVNQRRSCELSERQGREIRALREILERLSEALHAVVRGRHADVQAFGELSKQHRAIAEHLGIEFVDEPSLTVARKKKKAA